MAINVNPARHKLGTISGMCVVDGKPKCVVDVDGNERVVDSPPGIVSNHIAGKRTIYYPNIGDKIGLYLSDAGEWVMDLVEPSFLS